MDHPIGRRHQHLLFNLRIIQAVTDEGEVIDEYDKKRVCPGPSSPHVCGDCYLCALTRWPDMKLRMK